MTGYLLDTDVLSSLRKQDREPVVRRLHSVEGARLAISAITVGEIQRGIEAKRATDPVFSQRLELWLAGILSDFGDRILPVSVSVARIWGGLCLRLKHKNPDLLIAATALDWGLVVATGNEKDFRPCQVNMVNPFNHR